MTKEQVRDEIFNYIELRESLIEKGHSFKTQSDTEVILHLYQEKGEDCVDDLNGQFAFSIWDPQAKRLFLARDRVGIRPLYYARTQNEFIFASEMKAILSHDRIHREMDLEALDETFTFWCPVAPRTIFRNIHALPPGHTLTIENGELRSRCYWQLEMDTRTADLSEEQSIGQESLSVQTPQQPETPDPQQQIPPSTPKEVSVSYPS